MTIQEIHNKFLECNSVSIDTRKILPNSLFVAIKGEKFDANTFVKEALEKGANYALIDNPNYLIDHRTILVSNSLTTLQELAKFHRNYLKLPIVALTGSNGKTTTKELIQTVLSQKYNTKATIGNLDNAIGVPLTLLAFDKNTEIGVVEMGANHKKEIEFLCNIATPDFGYITNFGKAHLEGFGGVLGVIEGKSEMYSYLKQNKKTAFINLGDTIQEEKSKQLPTCFSFGVQKENANINIEKVQANPFVSIAFQGTTITTQMIGLYNAANCNAALTIGMYFGIDIKQIKKALENYIPENNRSQLISKNTNEIILDAYNANPSSMAVAIDNFLQLNKTNKIMVLGDMFELGSESLKEHQAIIKRLETQNEVECIFVGDFFYKNKNNTNLFSFFSNFDDLAKHLAHLKLENKTILIKGSRGMALERVLSYL